MCKQSNKPNGVPMGLIRYARQTLPTLIRNHNEAHVDLFQDWLKSPICFEMDRNTQNDLILRGSKEKIKMALPYTEMAINLNRPIKLEVFGKSKIAVLDTIWIGTKTQRVYTAKGFKKHIQEDVANRIVWLQSHAKGFDHIEDILSDCTYLSWVWESTKTELSLMDTNDFIARLWDADNDSQLAQYVMSQCGNTLINEWLKVNGDAFEEIDTVAWYAKFRALGQNMYVFDWFRSDKCSKVMQSLSETFFDDPLHTEIYNEVKNLIVGFTCGWENRQITEQVVNPTGRKNSRKHGRNVSGVRKLKYDTNAGSMIVSKTVQIEPTIDPNDEPKWKVTGHARSATNAFQWLLERNVKQGELVYGTKDRNGKILCKVLRPRRSAIINGGSSQVTKGIIKSV
jgi:hypothetical protein